MYTLVLHREKEPSPISLSYVHRQAPIGWTRAVRVPSLSLSCLLYTESTASIDAEGLHRAGPLYQLSADRSHPRYTYIPLPLLTLFTHAAAAARDPILNSGARREISPPADTSRGSHNGPRRGQHHVFTILLPPKRGCCRQIFLRLPAHGPGYRVL